MFGRNECQVPAECRRNAGGGVGSWSRSLAVFIYKSSPKSATSAPRPDITPTLIRKPLACDRIVGVAELVYNGSLVRDVALMSNTSVNSDAEDV